MNHNCSSRNWDTQDSVVVFSCCCTRLGRVLYPVTKYARCLKVTLMQCPLFHTKYAKLQFLSGLYHSCMFQRKGNILKILSAQYCVWINQTICADTAWVPVCLTVRAIWPLTRSMGVKGDFDPEASSTMEPASKAGKLAFPPAFSAHISLFPAALRESWMQTGAWNWDSKSWGIFWETYASKSYITCNAFEVPLFWGLCSIWPWNDLANYFHVSPKKQWFSFFLLLNKQTLR